jgi:hypothetical protein
VPLAEARQKALCRRRALIDGVDPLEAKRREDEATRISAAKTITFKDAAERLHRRP